MSSPFKVKPRHWWNYLNPFDYKRRRIVEKVLEYEWEHGGKEEVEQKFKNLILFGNSKGEQI